MSVRSGKKKLNGGVVFVDIDVRRAIQRFAAGSALLLLSGGLCCDCTVLSALYSLVCHCHVVRGRCCSGWRSKHFHSARKLAAGRAGRSGPPFWFCFCLLCSPVSASAGQAGARLLSGRDSPIRCGNVRDRKSLRATGPGRPRSCLCGSGRLFVSGRACHCRSTCASRMDPGSSDRGLGSLQK
jgi:hypothetical protein